MASNSNSWLIDLLQNKELSDVTVIVGEEDREFKLHRVILAQRSPFFANLLKLNNGEHKKLVKLPNIDADSFSAIVTWAYSDKIQLSASNASLTKGTFQTACYLGMETLKSKIVAHIAEFPPTTLNLSLIRPTRVRTIHFLLDLFQSSDIEEFKNMKVCTDMVAKYASFGSEEAVKILNNKEEANREFFASLAASYSDIVDSMICSKCHPSKPEPQTKCVLCKYGVVKGS